MITEQKKEKGNLKKEEEEEEEKKDHDSGDREEWIEKRQKAGLRSLVLAFFFLSRLPNKSRARNPALFFSRLEGSNIKKHKRGSRRERNQGVCDAHADEDRAEEYHINQTDKSRLVLF